jgi:SAM-dependent methyltransferase
MNNRPVRPSLATRIEWSVSRRGILGTLRRLLLKFPRSFASWVWDRLHRVNSSKVLELGDLDIPSENVRHGVRYQATPPGIFRRMISDLDIPYEQFNFIDFGSGMGRTLLLASEFPFRRIIGVEFSPELHRIAERNIQSFRGRQNCFEIRSVCIDAAQYRLPPGNAVSYFYLPFHEPVMRSVLAMIDDCLQSSRAEMIILAYEPNGAMLRVLGGDPAFRMTAQNGEYAIYRSLLGPVGSSGR